MMTPQQRTNKIAQLEQWLQDNPNHADRSKIQSDLRELKKESIPRPYERDTFDMREPNFYNV
ncbi:hypothetical protein [Flavobacterium gilvum]|uniref:Uncharacterized protein n=1 Tax=Flavobacterium gilvum TaxID=1492737 RepID=A0AAC9I6G3_9FLAO|nr:hypothetical protein [Flavobacterium gilvum]AOW09488.1 hypothetical protein EM308_08245 [Flavobacterium gilvum]KFC60849.1 hypothetical protein FEM08_04080 [Flavobacterium gilvum]